METDKSTTRQQVVIIGAGLVGSLLGIYLAKRGHSVSIYERRGDMRREAMVAGRSINLALSDRGIKALREVGILDEIMKIAIPMKGRAIHNADGSSVFQPYGKEGQAINSVSRGELNKKLMDLAEQHGVSISFHTKCDTIDWEQKTVHFDAGDAGGDLPVRFDLLFGADGAFAASRMQHMLQHDSFNYQQHYINCAYKELTIPAGENGSFLIEKNALHIWPRKAYMLIALPNIDGSFTCTLFFPASGELTFNSLDTAEKVNEFFAAHFNDVTQLIPDLAAQYLHNPVATLVTVKCAPWIRGDHFTLIGDAAHAIVPFFGQGMNCGFEDCSVLDGLIEKHGDNWAHILEAFQQLRKPDADAIADLAINNFTEMQAKTADPSFLLQKKIEAKLHEKYPDQWIPAYSQVTFSPQIRYSEAMQRGQMQEAIMQEIMQLPDISEKWADDALHLHIIEKVQGYN